MTAALARPCRLQILTPILERTCMSPHQPDVGALSDVGLIYADREYLALSNRAGGLDYRARINDRWTFTGQALTLPNTEPQQRHARRTNLRVARFNLQRAGLHDAGQLHRPAPQLVGPLTTISRRASSTDTGFFERPDVRQPSAHYSYTFRPMHGPLLSHGLSIYSDRIWDHNGVPLDFYLNPSYSFSFKGPYLGFCQCQPGNRTACVRSIIPRSLPTWSITTTPAG